ncbi:MAG TPA: hypothetical protein VNI54_14590 [Thermoanaerobaculia bacterium]|nr:hypothetical protein [Thermoanaerobaculia bacterium]
MAPTIVTDALAALNASSVVLDPMSGSGTVLAIAQSRGHRAIGMDVDPLAVLIAKVWGTPLRHSVVFSEATTVLQQAREWFAVLPQSQAYPVGADEETRAFLRYWFDGYSRRQLAALVCALNCLPNSPVKNALWCAVSRMIITKQAGVSLARDLSHSRPHRAYDVAPKKPFKLFPEAVRRTLEGILEEDMASDTPRMSVRRGDARRMSLAEDSVDLVFTSPPYLNAIDYLRCSKFALVWMGFRISELRQIRSDSIGAEVGVADTAELRVIQDLGIGALLSPRTQAVLRRYISDMRQVMSEVARVLRPGAKAIYVVGENTIRGTYVPTGEIVTQVARECGLRLHEKHFRMLPSNRRYLPPPGDSSNRNALDARMRREVVITFGKTESPSPTVDASDDSCHLLPV